MSQFINILAMILGFGFVVFFHELGHFLAAKWVGIRVEQFAVGFGQALFSWRKGMGITAGSSRKQFDERIRQHLAAREAAAVQSEPQLRETSEKVDGAGGPTPMQQEQAARELGLGETEYRLNWIPLGGYVKMLGQDDLKPGEGAEDPRAYNKKSVGARMLVVSAGVIMNIILAGIGFMVVFLIGFNAPPPVVGSVSANSPAQLAPCPSDPAETGLRVGDRLVTIDGARQHDFTKTMLTSALLHEGEEVAVVVQRPQADGSMKELTLLCRPARLRGESKGFLALGISPSPELKGPKAGPDRGGEAEEPSTLDSPLIKPGDVITRVNGLPVRANGPGESGKDEYYKLDRAIQASDGRPVTLTVENAGQARTVQLRPEFADSQFGKNGLSFAGMQARPKVVALGRETSVRGKLEPGDVIQWAQINDESKDRKQSPHAEEFIELINRAAEKHKTVSLGVLRDGKDVALDDLNPTVETAKGRHGFGVSIIQDGGGAAVLAGTLPGTPASAAELPRGAQVLEVDKQPAANWFDVRRLLLAGGAGERELKLKVPDVAEPVVKKLTLADADVLDLSRIRLTHSLALHELNEPRKTSSPLTAAAWGASETRDFVLQFYVTLKRMFQGSVSASNMMGPLGMVSAGAKFAVKGPDWLIWFLAMISANLAVVNFLPIPIVDGGLFTFLIIEKLQGRPASPRTQAVAQIVGFALIISVFVLVTFQDVARMLGH